LEHLTAFGVAAGAGDAVAVFGVLALALAAVQIANADLLAVADAAAVAIAFANRLAQAVQIGAFSEVVAAAMNSEAALALLKRDLAGHGILHVWFWRRASKLLGFALRFGYHATGHREHSIKRGLRVCFVAGQDEGPRRGSSKPSGEAGKVRAVALLPDECREIALPKRW
jgi:hypothetical protein